MPVFEIFQHSHSFGYKENIFVTSELSTISGCENAALCKVILCVPWKDDGKNIGNHTSSYHYCTNLSGDLETWNFTS